MNESGLPDVYAEAELYDLVFAQFVEDLPFWTRVGHEARGPVLDLACGTGRVLLQLLDQGVDADGLEAAPAMVERARAKAQAKGYKPRLVQGDMRDFTMPRRYARIVCAFNAFAHAMTIDDQLRTLRCAREHLESGGALVVHLSYPAPAYWLEPDSEPVKEIEVERPGTGTRIQLWDTRTKDPVAQRQSSVIEYRELDAAGQVVSSRRATTSQRWVYRWEMELLMRGAGFSRCEIQGGYRGEPLERTDQPMIAWGWKD